MQISYKKRCKVNYQSVMRDCFDELEYTTSIDMVLSYQAFYEVSTGYDDDIKTKKIADSLYILDLLAKK